MITTARTTVFIAEDSALIRARLMEMLGQLEGVGVVGDAETPGDAISGILRTSPDYVVLDFQLHGGTAVDVLRAVHSLSPTTKFLVLTNHANPQYRRVCLDEGATGFFDKSLEFEKVRDLIAAVDPLRHE
jgi:DNA-binding NarL/FixJ family response regulator